MRAWRVAGILVACVVSASAVPSASPARTPVETPAPVLVELFTSEGCSSCPPADQLLTELARTRFVAGAQVIALSEHVDYWNQLGWTDPFSSREFSDRQAAYGKSLRTDVYTPQVVVDGRFVAVGSDRDEVLQAIRSAAAKNIPATSLTWTPDLRITVEPSRWTVAAEVYLAITEDGLTSNVRRGENAGRQLSHVAVTRRLTRIGTTSRDGSFSQNVAVAPMLDQSWHRSALRVVVFLQTKSGVVCVTSTPLPD
jgi:hypothetical protein